MKLRFTFIFILIFASIQTAMGQQSPPAPETSRAYLIGPGDKIVGKVLGEPDFSFESIVDDDGRIQVPFFEEGVMAKCRTEKQLRADVTELLAKYLRNPQVTVQVTERNSRPPVTIYGEVKQQQQIDLRREARLLELISFAGGVTEDAGGLIQVFRTRPPLCSDATEENNWKAETEDSFDVPSRLYSLNSVKQGQDNANPVILPGDIIVVHRASPVYFTGEVRQPTGILLKDGGLTLTQALAMVGGVNREAKTKEIKIYRLKENSKDREIIAVNFDLIKKGEQKDVVLQPYDIVEVDRSKKSIGQIIFETVTGAARTVVTGTASSFPTRVIY
jgi:polysaccharide export outer membrane protein